MASVTCKIDGVVIATPKYKLSNPTGDLQSEGYTDALGYIHKETIRFDKQRLNLEWSYLTYDEFNKIANLTKKEYFKFELITSAGYSLVINQAYRGNIDKTIMSLRTGFPEYEGVKVPIIER